MVFDESGHIRGGGLWWEWPYKRKTTISNCLIIIFSMFFVYFLFQLTSALKSGTVSNSRFAKAVEKSSESETIPVERSGGGV